MKKTQGSYLITRSRLGNLLLASSADGLCAVRWGDTRSVLEREFRKDFGPGFSADATSRLKKWAKLFLDYLNGRMRTLSLPVDLQGTPFQKKVWNELRRIPTGRTSSYSDLARRIGKPKAVRAVAGACAANPAALIIPCHRVLPKSGGIGGYHWHPKRKRFLLKLEAESGG